MVTHTHIHTYIHTHTHDNYYNPRCAHAHRGLIIIMGGARSLFEDIDRRILTVTQDPRSHEYLVQRIAVLIVTTRRSVQRSTLLFRGETQLRCWGLFLVGIIIIIFIYIYLLLFVYYF